jgi:hypothetical protein
MVTERAAQHGDHGDRGLENNFTNQSESMTALIGDLFRSPTDLTDDFDLFDHEGVAADASHFDILSLLAGTPLEAGWTLAMIEFAVAFIEDILEQSSHNGASIISIWDFALGALPSLEPAGYAIGRGLALVIAMGREVLVIGMEGDDIADIRNETSGEIVGLLSHQKTPRNDQR